MLECVAQVNDYGQFSIIAAAVYLLHNSLYEFSTCAIIRAIFILLSNFQFRPPFVTQSFCS